MKKALAGLGLGALLLGVAGCGDFPEYRYSGPIGKDHVIFSDQCGSLGGDNYLAVTKPDGTRFLYTDKKKDDLIFETIKIQTKNTWTDWDADKKKIVSYHNWRTVDTYKIDDDNPEIAEIAAEAQIAADWYLKNILSSNTAPMRAEMSRILE